MNKLFMVAEDIHVTSPFSLRSDVHSSWEVITAHWSTEGILDRSSVSLVAKLPDTQAKNRLEGISRPNIRYVRRVPEENPGNGSHLGRR